MSEVFDQGQATAPAHAVSAGVLIRRAREAAGVHIAALAVALKVPVRRLEALEADRYDLLPDAVFARALASSVCRSLKIDPGQILPLLPKSSTQPLSVEGHINEPFRSSQQASAAWASRMSPLALISGVLLLVLALAVYFWPEISELMPDVRSPSSAVQSEPPPAALPASVGTVVETVPSASASLPPAPAAAAEPAPPSPPPATR